VNILLQIESNRVKNASFVFLSSGIGELKTGLFKNVQHIQQGGQTCSPSLIQKGLDAEFLWQPRSMLYIKVVFDNVV